MSNRYWAAIAVFIFALGLLVWGWSLHPDETAARAAQFTPYLAKGLGVIGIIGSMLLFLNAARHSHTYKSHELTNTGENKTR